MTGFLLHFLKRFIQGHYSVDDGTHLTVPDAAKGLEIQSVSLAHQTAHLFQESLLNHPLTAPVDAIIQVAALPAQTDLDEFVRIVAKGVLALPLAERFAGKLIDFQGANDALTIMRMDRRQDARINLQ